MPVKRKRNLEEFDPNKSDSEDENFDPSEHAPRTSKKARPSRGSRPVGSKKKSKYRGSDIEEDELSDSQLEGSFDEGDFDDEDDDDDEDAPVNAAGRRARKVATKQLNYKESSEEEAEDDAADDSDEAPATKKKGQSQRLLIKLKVPPNKTRDSGPPTRRSTRARTEELDEPLIALSNSGRHVEVTRNSRSKSPEALARVARSSRGMKGLKRAPEPIQEATQESSGPKVDDDDDADPLAGEPDMVEPVEDKDDKMEDAADKSDADEQEAQKSAVEVQDDDEDDEAPITRRTRTRASISAAAGAEPDSVAPAEENAGRRRLRSGLRKSLQEPSSDFEPGDDSDEAEQAAKSASDSSEKNDDMDDSPMPRRGRKGRSNKSSRRGQESADEVELDQDELAEELHELRQDSRSRSHRARRRHSPDILYQEPTKRRRAATRPVNYYMPPLPAVNVEDEEAADDPAPTPARRRAGRGGASTGWERALNTTFGPFGGGGGGSILGGPWGTGVVGGVESDSSDDEVAPRASMAGNVGMTPTTATGPGLIPGLGPPINLEGLGSGATPNVGKLKDKKALADADPLGVDLNVDFSQVGGLQGHIDQLKEMVQLPLLYPEAFLKFHVTPPRGVLFHGPPGTGKTLLARALANSVGSGGRKITFYMRKGADALSKWVGEAEKQLRLLFEEARRTQPSIIFFDEIDGLAPVRSSKQEQIHASIVSTLLALMDGMDGRGQVIVIGATNRPDNIDPALRRPGRFDREFYFPLPDVTGRKSIIDIHTRDWGLSDEFKLSLAANTKGYGGADLRALCTEAALNAIQRTYPQIYSSKEKLVIDPDSISVHATDFMISIKKMIPSSERSASSSAAPLPKTVEPLLRTQFQDIKKALDDILPRHKKMTALEEAMFEPHDDTDHGFGREAMQQEFERTRVFRPRYLIHGMSGMGQNYLSSAILHYLEGVHVQHFDLPSLLGDGRPMEQVIVGMFTEIKRHKPSVIYIPNIDTWFHLMVNTMALPTFQTMLRSIPPADPVLLLATAECERSVLPQELVKEFFGYSRKNAMEIRRPANDHRREYFEPIYGYIKKRPTEFPDPANRKKRVLEQLAIASAPSPKPPSKADIKALQKRDHQLLNVLKVQLQPIMDQINRRYKKFRQPVIPYQQLQYLFDESDPNYVRPDLAEGQIRPFEIVKDKHGLDVLRETATGKIFYNLETTTIEERLSNGYYARPKDFLHDIRSLARDAKNVGDKERTLKANELLSNVEVDVATIEQNTQTVDWEALYQRQCQRAKEAAEKERKRKAGLAILGRVASDVGGNDSDAGPVTLGEPIPGSRTTTARFQVIGSPLSNGHGRASPTPHQLSNGTSDPADVSMGGMDESTAPEMKPPPMGSQWPRMELKPVDQSARATVGGTQLSQKSVITTVPPGVSPSALANDASTTKTSDPSEKSSSKWSTQATNGYHAEQYSPTGTGMGQSNSQMPDTQRDPAMVVPASQETSSDSPWIHSQVPGLAGGGAGAGVTTGGSGSPTSSQIPPQGPAGTNSSSNRSSGGPKSSHATPSIGNLLNDPAPDESSGHGSSGSQQQQYLFYDAQVRMFLEDLTARTSGCTIEQLEQINRELMDEIWKTRGEWNRMKVYRNLVSVFNETIQDIEQMQGVLDQSQVENDGL